MYLPTSFDVLESSLPVSAMFLHVEIDSLLEHDAM